MSADNYILLFQFDGKWYLSDLSASRAPADPNEDPPLDEIMGGLLRDYYYDKALSTGVRGLAMTFPTRDDALDHFDRRVEEGYVCEYGVRWIHHPIPVTPETQEIFRKAREQLK